MFGKKHAAESGKKKYLYMFEEGNKDFREASRDAYRSMGEFHSSTTFVSDIFNVVILIAGGLFLYNGSISFADYSAFVVSVGLFLNPVNTLIRFMEQFQSGVAGFERYVEIMDVPEEVDLPQAQPVGRVAGAVSLRHVTFGYGDEEPVLTDVSMDIPAGATFALVGPSGGGKTTICHLIPRFYSLTAGDILIDGMSIRNITAASLRRNIGIVQQDVYLFSGTVAQNIAYGKPGATREEIMEAARLAGAEKFILALKDGFDTYVGERGVKLSGGQKQRIAIARVFLKNPPILILDEATSALDNESEILVGQSLEKLAHGRTTLTIAHRLTTIKDYDRILVLGEEGIVEQGTHAQLLEKQGVYYRLWNQLPGDETL